MPNALDYLAWRGDLTLDRDGWNDVDMLLMACLSYSDPAPLAGRPLKDALKTLPALPQDAPPLMAQHRALLNALAASRRFGGFVVSDFADTFDAARGIQFSAMTVDAPDGVRVVSFRGTDGTLVGWREDFAMTFETPVPAQTAAAEYLQRAAGGYGGLVLAAGHSKGGNLAFYAAAHLDETAQGRVGAVYSFDGPGLDEVTVASENYARIEPRLRSFVPQSSVIGMLLSYHPEYTVVQSAERGIQQHNPYSWQAIGRRFITLERLGRSSQVIDKTLNRWLKSCTPQQRRAFVDTLFGVLESTNAETLSDMKRNIIGSASAIIDAARKVDPDTGRMLTGLMGKLVLAGTGSLVDQLFNPDRSDSPPGING